MELKINNLGPIKQSIAPTHFQLVYEIEVILFDGFILPVITLY